MARMPVVAIVAMLAAAVGIAYVKTNRSRPDDGNEAKTTSAPAVTEAPAKPIEAPPMATTAKPVEAVRPPSSPNDVAQWIANTQSSDAKMRADAIQALANAPKAQALPALKRVLESGEPQVDRQIALRSLHVLALNDGDDTGTIRDTIRYAVYHSDDEGAAQSAQAYLEDIEAALAERTEGAPQNDPAGFPFARPSD